MCRLASDGVPPAAHHHHNPQAHARVCVCVSTLAIMRSNINRAWVQRRRAWAAKMLSRTKSHALAMRDKQTEYHPPQHHQQNTTHTTQLLCVDTFMCSALLTTLKERARVTRAHTHKSRFIHVRNGLFALGSSSSSSSVVRRFGDGRTGKVVHPAV